MRGSAIALAATLALVPLLPAAAAQPCLVGGDGCIVEFVVCVNEPCPVEVNPPGPCVAGTEDACIVQFVVCATTPCLPRVNLPHAGCIHGGECFLDDPYPEGPIIVCVVDGPFCGFGLPERPCIAGEGCLARLP